MQQSGIALDLHSVSIQLESPTWSPRSLLFFSVRPRECWNNKSKHTSSSTLFSLLNLTLLLSWLIDYDGVRLCLRTAATNGPIVHPPGDMWAWSAMVMMMSAGDNSWLVHQSSLAVLSAETSEARRRNGRRSENFAYQYLKYLKGF
jgi:hypothetical protein